MGRELTEYIPELTTRFLKRGKLELELIEFGPELTESGPVLTESGPRMVEE